MTSWFRYWYPFTQPEVKTEVTVVTEKVALEVEKVETQEVVSEKVVSMETKEVQSEKVVSMETKEVEVTEVTIIEVRSIRPSLEDLKSVKLRPVIPYVVLPSAVPEGIAIRTRLRHVCMDNCRLHTQPSCAGCPNTAACAWSCQVCNLVFCAKCKLRHECEDSD